MALLPISGISEHKQLFYNSCIPMSVECILKLEGIIAMDDFRYQNDPSKSGSSAWIDEIGPVTNSKGKSMLVQRRFEYNRNDDFLKNHFNTLFQTIDQELENQRYVVICLRPRTDGFNGNAFTLSNGNFHMYIIYGKDESNNTYALLDFDINRALDSYQNVNLISWVRAMMGTAIYTYTIISS